MERKKSLELDQGRLCLFVIARLLVDSRRPQQLPTTAFTCQLEYVLLANGSLFLAVAILHNILSSIFQPQSNIYLLPRLLLTRQVSCGRRVPAAVAAVANRGETLEESAANAQ